MAEERGSHADGECEVEENFGGPVFEPRLYIQRYYYVQQQLIKHNATSVVDFGCAECKFSRFLVRVPKVEKIALVDVDRYLLESSRFVIRPQATDFLVRRERPLSVQMYCGSVTDLDTAIAGYDAVSMVEIIEHLQLDTLAGAENMVFGALQPRVVVITTPNADFNVLFPGFSGFRHYDHKFEWTRQQFQDWCNSITDQFPYHVEYGGIGEPPSGYEHLGQCSQAAVFIRWSDYLKSENSVTSNTYKLVAECTYPHKQASALSEDDAMLMELQYLIRQHGQASRNIYNPERDPISHSPYHDPISHSTDQDPISQSTDHDSISHSTDHDPISHSTDHDPISHSTDHDPISPSTDYDPISRSIDYDPISHSSGIVHNPISLSTDHDPISCSTDHDPIFRSTDHDPFFRSTGTEHKLNSHSTDTDHDPISPGTHTDHIYIFGHTHHINNVRKQKSQDSCKRDNSDSHKFSQLFIKQTHSLCDHKICDMCERDQQSRQPDSKTEFICDSKSCNRIGSADVENLRSHCSKSATSKLTFSSSNLITQELRTDVDANVSHELGIDVDKTWNLELGTSIDKNVHSELGTDIDNFDNSELGTDVDRIVSLSLGTSIDKNVHSELGTNIGNFNNSELGTDVDRIVNLGVGTDIDNLVISEPDFDNLLISEPNIDNLVILDPDIDNLKISEPDTDNLMISEPDISPDDVVLIPLDSLMKYKQIKAKFDTDTLRAFLLQHGFMLSKDMSCVMWTVEYSDEEEEEEEEEEEVLERELRVTCMTEADSTKTDDTQHSCLGVDFVSEYWD